MNNVKDIVQEGMKEAKWILANVYWILPIDMSVRKFILKKPIKNLYKLRYEEILTKSLELTYMNI